MEIQWNHIQNLSNRDIICGYCGKAQLANQGWSGTKTSKIPTGTRGAVVITSARDPVKSRSIYVCIKCGCPNYFDDAQGKQTPGAKIGRKINKLPEEIENFLDNEIKACFSAGAYGACVMAGRKLLMNICVKKGAKEGKSFESYVDYLDETGYIPPDGKHWVTEIKKLGNKANHRIVDRTREDAEKIIIFIEALLLYMYELASDVSNRS